MLIDVGKIDPIQVCNMRKAGIETFRFIAILFVVVIHAYPIAQPGGEFLNQLARFAVPYFFVISGYFFFQKVASDSAAGSHYMLMYGSRLTYIYVFWYLIYAYWPLFSPDNWATIAHSGLYDAFSRESSELLTEFKNHLLYYLLAGGRADHLWFLPSLGMAIVFLYISIRMNILGPGFIVAAVLYALALVLEPYSTTPLSVPLHMSGRNGPFFSSIFVFIGALVAKYRVQPSRRLAIAIALIGVAMHFSEVMVLHQLYGVPVQSHNFVLGTLLFGTGVALYAISSDGFGVKYNVYRLGRYTLGIYVIHLLVIDLLKVEKLMPELGILRVALVTTLSLMIAAVLSRFPLVRRVV